MDIYLKRATLHMMDRNNESPILSDTLLDLTQHFVAEYVENKVKKIATSQTKTGKLNQESVLGKIFSLANKENFIATGQEFMENWAKIYTQSEDAPSSDVLMALYEKDSQLYFAFIKLAYKDGLTHFVENAENGINNKLVMNRAILPASSSKPDEAFAVNLSTLEYELIEKRFEFSGEKQFYFAQYLLAESEQPQASVDQSVSAVKKLAKSIGRKYEDDEYEVMANVKEALFDSFEEYGVIEQDFLAEKVFGENLSAKLEFKDGLRESLPTENREMDEIREISDKKFGKQKLKMDNGIELIVPLEVYRDANAVEFINNPDGTISIVIKNIEKIVNKI
ncbi:hypothetical protein SAMN02745116_00060 [Pilibacter termitis]|uniref:Nucleoid-associated protein n=1 Tax=Pilibacter termitis TaxID=263852 RepID=A0A1T4K328_9ENTE|nr:nucleoid-associated protein [Pilibacter termitis]SJZ36862.1 hypothetical protein SAMN02745116_00060 [Pilibacter termitis]